MRFLIHYRQVIVSVVMAFCLEAAACRADDGPKMQTLEVKGVKLRYYSEGTGPAVVLIHGLHSSARINWQVNQVFADLAKSHQVIALDLPGHGASDKPEDEAAYGTQMVEDVVALMDHLKIDKAHVVGYSMGGMIALKLIVTHPDRVLSGTLGGMGWLRDGSRLQQFWERMPVRDGARTPGACSQSLGKLAVTEAELKAVKIPMAVFVGDRDPVKRLYVTPLQSVRNDWPVTEIPDAGHLNCIVKPEFRNGVTKWVEQQAKK